MTAMAWSPTLLGPADNAYPPALLRISSPPARLWVAGQLPVARCIAVVGTRSADAEGLALARRLAYLLTEAGIGVLSGLALGIDTAAHEGTLAAGGQTWAVLGSGLGRIYPPANAELARRIVSAGGGLLSEIEPDRPASPRSLVARDRLQAALAAAVLIVQSELGSGTMHTARFALLQGRPLAVALPPGCSGPKWSGNHALASSEGCEPGALAATGRTAELVRSRRPVADAVFSGADDESLLPWLTSKAAGS
ncbi:MAG: DNA-processing protein DprA [Acidimicrobiales bacterium]